MNVLKQMFTIIALPMFLILGSTGISADDKDCIPVKQEIGDESMQQSDAASKRFLVKFDSNVSESEIQTINSRLGVKVINRMLSGRLLLVEVAYQNTMTQIIEAYNNTPGVEYAEPDQPVSIPTPPTQESDPAPKPDEEPPLIELPEVK